MADFRHGRCAGGPMLHLLTRGFAPVTWMRANPLVCVEVENIVSREEWQTVVIFGRYQELPRTPEFHNARVVAHELLARTAVWWEPGYVKTLHQGLERPFQPVHFRILINEISGHQGIADAPLA